jgi:hypothetical protein
MMQLGSKADVAQYIAGWPAFVPTPDERARLNQISELTDRGYVGVSIIAHELGIELEEAQDRLCEWVGAGYGVWVTGREGIAARNQGDFFDNEVVQ